MAEPVINLDNNATTKPTPAVRDAVLRALEETWHNPSSVHRAGQAARQTVELARASIARLLNARPREIVLTSGGTESLELAIRGVVASRTDIERPVVISSRVEHAAVRDLVEPMARACEFLWAPLDSKGVIDSDGLAALIDGRTALVCVQWANNETGAIQPVRAIGGACRAAGVPLLVDGTQRVGKLPVNMGTGTSAPGEAAHDDDAGEMIDLMACSAHKLHGAKGAGALFVRRGTRMGVVRPGSQELGRRGGTENVPGIAGFGAACDEALVFLGDPAERARLGAMRDRLESAILVACPDARVNGPASDDARLWNTTNIGFPRIEAEALLLMLSERGVCASAGAACSSGSLEPSPVLLAMGVDPVYAHGSIRLSLSRYTADAEVASAAAIVADAARTLGASLPSV